MRHYLSWWQPVGCYISIMKNVNMEYIWLFLVSLGFIQCQVTTDVCSIYCRADPDGGIICDAVTGQCLHGCVPGYAGSHCTIQCCGGCKSCSESDNGIVCDECHDGFYLETGQCFPCSKTCAHNTSSSLSSCYPMDGSCKFGCRQGLYGAMCDRMCSETCRTGVCDHTDGSCSFGCILPVLTGPMCQEACSEGCKRRECDQSGTCITDGCQQGYWGAHCSLECSKNCVEPDNNVDPVCDQQNATCLRGCMNNTYWGSNCSHVCSSNCVNKKCDFENGDCIGGCKDKFEGPKCSEEMKADDKMTIIIASAVGGVVFIIIVIVIICVVCRKCRK